MLEHATQKVGHDLGACSSACRREQLFPSMSATEKRTHWRQGVG